MSLRQTTRQVAIIAPFVCFTAVAVWGILVLPGKTGVKQVVIDGTCSQPHLQISFSARPYTGVLLLDKQLCILVEIFFQAFQPPGERFTQHFLWGLSPLIIVILLEGARRDRPWFFNSLLLGITYQLWTIGLALSIFWMPFILACSKGAAKRPVSQRDAEGALVAVFIGYCLPTAMMLGTKSAIAIALWQPFPIYMSTVQYIWPRIRSKGSSLWPSSLQPALIIATMPATAAQFYTLYPSLSHITLSEMVEWLPGWIVPFGSISVEKAVLGFLQYDAFTAYGSTIVVGLLLMESAGEAALWLAMAPAGMLLLSPGGYIAALWIQRERCLTAKKIART